jgi:hypothetical protein
MSFTSLPLQLYFLTWTRCCRLGVVIWLLNRIYLQEMVQDNEKHCSRSQEYRKSVKIIVGYHLDVGRVYENDVCTELNLAIGSLE